MLGQTCPSMDLEPDLTPSSTEGVDLGRLRQDVGVLHDLGQTVIEWMCTTADNAALLPMPSQEAPCAWQGWQRAALELLSQYRR